MALCITAETRADVADGSLSASTVTGWRGSYAANNDQTGDQSASQQTPSLLDHLVGDGEHTWRDGETEHFGSREIDGKIKFCRLLNRDIAGLRPAQILSTNLAVRPNSSK